MDATDGLRRLGLGEYEARAYAALVARPNSTGYEVAKGSGIPRSKIYETLATLASRDLVTTSQEGSRVRYHPTDHDALLRRHIAGAERLAQELAPLLRNLASDEMPPPLITVRSYEHILARARDVLASARQRAFVSGWPTEIAALAPELECVEARGKAVYALVYGDATVAIRGLFRHHPIAPRPGELLRASPLPWLIVVADHAEALIAQAAPREQAMALWTRQATIAVVAAEYVRHDIFSVEIDRLLGARGINLDRELAPLQAMWYDGLAGQTP